LLGSQCGRASKLRGVAACNGNGREKIQQSLGWAQSWQPDFSKRNGFEPLIRAHLAEQKALFSVQRFHDVAYHHAPDISFMTFRVSETLRASGEPREQRGIERYTFRDGRLATKDVYRKPISL
jgi:ketosteroid isomerase-like protein